jgi:hypothetical protein
MGHTKLQMGVCWLAGNLKIHQFGGFLATV